MSERGTVRFYLPDGPRQLACSGKHKFIKRFGAFLQAEGFAIKFHGNSLVELAKSTVRPGHSVFLMAEPTTGRGVTIRQNYYHPFWNIEQTGKRWEWPVAKAQFDAANVPATRARRFADHWRSKQFGISARDTSREGFVYVPLQGRLLAQRSFQFCSPVEMIAQVLEHEAARNVIATLHPKERYSDDELSALYDLEKRHARLTVLTRDMIPLLQGCDYVVTQNSSVALAGFFFQKPAVLFARINFHHIAANVHLLGPKDAMARVTDLTPDYDAYLWWFFQDMSIHFKRPDADLKMRDAIRRAGWVR